MLRTRPKEIHPGGRRVPWSQLEPITLPEDIPKFEMNLVRRGLPQSPRSPGQAPGRPPQPPTRVKKGKQGAAPATLARSLLQPSNRRQSQVPSIQQAAAARPPNPSTSATGSSAWPILRSSGPLIAVFVFPNLTYIQ